MKKTFEEWINCEDYGDVEQLRRCWNAATEAARYELTRALIISDEQFEREYPIQEETA